MKLPFSEDATSEFLASIDFYESERAGLGFEFFLAVEWIVEFADEFPDAGARVLDLPERFDVRTFVVQRFPFRVVVGTIADQRVVIALAHHSRTPDYWRRRVPEE